MCRPSARRRPCARRLETEFEGAVGFELIRWEEGWYSARAGFQEQIAAPDQCDLVIVIVWKRLGSLSPPTYDRADGSPRTGTEYEFETALQASLQAQRPDVLVYRKTAKILFEADRVEQERAELQALEDFWRLLDPQRTRPLRRRVQGVWEYRGV